MVLILILVCILVWGGLGFYAAVHYGVNYKIHDTFDGLDPGEILMISVLLGPLSFFALRAVFVVVKKDKQVKKGPQTGTKKSKFDL